MPVIMLASAAGSPGVTATCVGLSLVWPSDVLLVDADKHPTQSVLAGYLRGAGTAQKGLPGLARAAREGRPLSPQIADECVPLADGATRRLFLPGFANPAAAGLFEGVWSRLGESLQEHAAADLTVLLDIGRINADGPPAGLLQHADALLVLTHSHLPALAALRLYLPALAEQVERSQSSVQIGLLVVGPGRPYGVSEIERQFSLPVWAALPHDPAAAAVLAEGADEPRRFADGPYVRSLREAASAITTRVDARRMRVRGVA